MFCKLTTVSGVKHLLYISMHDHDHEKTSHASVPFYDFTVRKKPFTGNSSKLKSSTINQNTYYFCFIYKNLQFIADNLSMFPRNGNCCFSTCRQKVGTTAFCACCLIAVHRISNCVLSPMLFSVII